MSAPTCPRCGTTLIEYAANDGEGGVLYCCPKGDWEMTEPGPHLTMETAPWTVAAYAAGLAAGRQAERADVTAYIAEQAADAIVMSRRNEDTKHGWRLFGVVQGMQRIGVAVEAGVHLNAGSGGRRG